MTPAGAHQNNVVRIMLIIRNRHFNVHLGSQPISADQLQTQQFFYFTKRVRH